MLANHSFIDSQKLMINEIISKIKFLFSFLLGKNEMSFKNNGASKRIHEYTKGKGCLGGLIRNLLNKIILKFFNVYIDELK